MSEAPEEEERLYRLGSSQKISKDYKEARETFKQILSQTSSFSSYWNKAYKELADIEKLKREKTQWGFRATCPFLLLSGCILTGKALGVLTGHIPVGILGGAGVGLLLMACCILFISGENDY